MGLSVYLIGASLTIFEFARIIEAEGDTSATRKLKEWPKVIVAAAIASSLLWPLIWVVWGYNRIFR